MIITCGAPRGDLETLRLVTREALLMAAESGELAHSLESMQGALFHVSSDVPVILPVFHALLTHICYSFTHILLICY